MSHVYSLDIETAPTIQTDKPYALEPYRYVQGTAKITSVSVCWPDGHVQQVHERGAGEKSMEYLPEMLRHLSGKQVCAHYAVFDVAWLIAATSLDIVRQIHWKDTAGIAKWIYNSQSAEMPRKSYTLYDLVEENMKDHPRYREFLEMKGESHGAGENYEYWLNRGKLDALMTRDLYLKLLSIMPAPMVNGYHIEQTAIVPVANSWLVGIPLDIEAANKLKPKLAIAKKNIAASIGQPEGMFSSPKQLGNYLFNVLGLEPEGKTPKGEPSTSADNLKMMHLNYAGTEYSSKLQAIMDFKQVKTLESKFINGIIEVSAYNGYAINHSAPRIFSTYTGRFTYSSKTQEKENKCGIATHQLPRKGPTRNLLKAPKGYIIGELDAAAQELRIMAVESKDENLIRGFNDGLDLHGGMAADIAGESYDGFINRYKEEQEDAINFRYAGKLLNLSCQYRIGDNALKGKFFTTYGIVISRAIAASYLSMYKQRYPGVVKYWSNAIAKGKQNGYAETVGGRRFYLENWVKHAWATESSAINFPVQGGGGDHKVVAIGAIFNKFPEAIFLLDLHDGLWYAVPEDGGKEMLLEMRDYLNSLNHSEIWNKDIPIKLPFDAQIGTTFGDVKPIW